MKLCRSFVVGVIIAVVPGPSLRAHAQESSQEQAPTIRVAVDRVNVGVIVTNKNGDFVDGLRRNDFRIFDNERSNRSRTSSR
jgi:hypothetical protein